MSFNKNLRDKFIAFVDSEFLECVLIELVVDGWAQSDSNLYIITCGSTTRNCLLAVHFDF